MSRHLLLTALPWLLGCLPPAAAQDADAARIETRLRCDPDSRTWHVAIDASGFRDARDLWLELSNWGEWLRIDDYYLRGITCDPPLRRRAQRNEFDVVAPPDWNGELHARYTLPLAELASPAREAYGLLPYRAPTYCFGFAANTLAALQWDGAPDGVERWIEIEAPADWTIASGYAAPAKGKLRARIAPGIGNTAIGIGKPVATARAACGDVAVHVVQFGGDRDRAAPLAAFAQRYLEACTRSLGAPPARPLTLVVTEPGHGGTRTDGAIAVGCPAGSEAAFDVYTLHFLAHELFHDWLGGQLVSTQGEQLAWFWEGFTEYLSLWHLAHIGLVPRDWFAARVFDWEEDLRGNEHWGRAAFADPEVRWRDPAIEPLAYQGSALLALALDVELRKAAGGTGLVALLRGLLAQDGGRYSLASIRAWLAAHGLEEFWGAHVATGRRIDPRPLLAAIGFEEAMVPRPLPYVGVRLDRDGPFGTVVAVDELGPSAGLVRVGDVVTGLTPTHEPLADVASAAPEFPFGLAYFDLAPKVRIGVRRGGERMEIHVQPRTIDGPPVATWRAGPGLDAFFR